jgi:peptidoglycan/LPS O-acetylase OafA/YrhL
VRRIPQLDGLRALAVGLVIVNHVAGWFPGGAVGVNIFFVLSGYLITSLLLDEHEKTGRLRRGRFYIRRALRLYPALAVMLGVTFLLGGVALKSVLIAGSYTTNLFMTLSLNPVLPYTHTWSLAQEEQFYLLWPLLLPLFIRLGRRASVAILTVIAVGLAMWAQLAVNTVTASNGVVTVAVFNPLWQAHGLLIGCALAFAIRHRSVPSATLLVNLGLTLCIVVALAASVTAGRSARAAADWNLVSEFAAAAAIAGMTEGARGLARLCTLRPVLWIGKRSYAIYLWHFPLIWLATQHGYGKSGKVAAVVLAVLAAGLSWRLVEQPFLRLKQRFEPNTPKHARHDLRQKATRPGACEGADGDAVELAAQFRPGRAARVLGDASQDEREPAGNDRELRKLGTRPSG